MPTIHCSAEVLGVANSLQVGDLERQETYERHHITYPFMSVEMIFILKEH